MQPATYGPADVTMPPGFVDVDPDDLHRYIEYLRSGAADVLPFQVIELEEIVEALPRSVKMAAFDCATPIEFAEKILGRRPTARQVELGLGWYWAGQEEVWKSLVENQYTLVLSGNGLGKTFLAAVAALWLYYRGYAVITTAPTARQVQELLWAEIRTLRAEAEEFGVILPGQWGDVACTVRDPKHPKHTLMGYTARVRAGEMDATSFKGKHYKRMAVIVDEGIGVDRAIFAAIDALVLGDPDSRVLVIGNPTDQQSYCYELEHLKAKDGVTPMVKTIHLNGEDHPNVVLEEIVIPGAVTKEFIDLQFAKGGSRESAFYRTTVRGEWPGDVKDALIQMSWVREAQRRAEDADERDAKIIEYALTLPEGEQQVYLRSYLRKDNRGIALGLDVAGEGDNLTVLTGCQNGRIFYPRLSRPCWHVGKDHTHAVDLVFTALKELKRVLALWIDDTGLGAAVSADIAKRRNELPQIPIVIVKGPQARPAEYITQTVVNRINFGGSPPERDDERLAKMRDTLYWEMREALRPDPNNKDKRLLILPTDQEHRAAGFPPKSDLFAQLANPILWRDRHGLLHVLDKRDSEGPHEKTQNLPTLSPDLAHSAMLAYSAWVTLPDRQAAPETVPDFFAAKVQAMKAAMSVGSKADNKAMQLLKSPYARKAR